MNEVSILTITQYKRFECLKNLFTIIQNQKYKIKEWIIVEGSQNPDHKSKNICQIKGFIFDKPFIHLIEPDDIVPLSNLRNIGNDHCSGDIIICMDDDDYYQPVYISHIVKLFTIYNRDIAGCSGPYMYDYCYKTLYKFKGYHNNHSTNNCMAYRREYLKNHRYKEGLYMAEEYSFTNGFTEPMIGIKPENGIIISSHTHNTVDKDRCINSEFIDIIEKDITDMIPVAIFENMQCIFEKI